jgi:hypothetical protein
MAVPVTCPSCGCPECRTVRTIHDAQTDALQIETWRDHRCPACHAEFQSLARLRVLVQSVRPAKISLTLATHSTRWST